MSDWSTRFRLIFAFARRLVGNL